MAKQQIKTQVTRVLKKLPKKYVALVVLVIAAFLVITDRFDLLPDVFTDTVNTGVESNYSIHFINVGQGDSALIKFEDANILIDAGESDKGTDVVRYLNENNVEKLDMVIATHPHADHIGGMRVVLENIEVEKLILPRVPDELVPTTKAYENMLKTAKKNNVKVSFIDSMQDYRFGDLLVKNIPANGEYDDLNDYSIVTKLTFNGTSALFTGDITKTAESYLLDQGINVKADLLKVAHHGSKGSTGQDFVDAVTPTDAVISVGFDNDYGHPNKDVVNKRLKDADVYMTDTDGSVVFEYQDGELKKVS